MTQFLASTPEQVIDALARGAKWIHYTDPTTLGEILAPAEQALAIVTIPGSANLAKETRVHGVILAPGDMPAAQAREFLGPNAVIGCRVGSSFEIMNLAGVDVDFFVLDAPIEEFAKIVDLARKGGVEQRIVAFSSDSAYLQSGADALMHSDLNLI